MNTIRSTWYGWGALCVAGGGAYYFAKKSVNADRAARYEADMKRKAELAKMEAQDRRRAQEIRKPTDDPSLQRANANSVSYTARDDVASPSREAGQDPAPTRHEPETDEQGLLEKSKYEATQPFRPPRGNRFS
ncbi:conserved hypothetical protein [Talaromyces stipitatus ATCC 10500]|uniref:Uncharacterized protein n=1 Tax=Talaromyces stipitatus (strain ATCC 10500 / CBS 375.48 / QM 6759 / NRRL 1006) TaxID=441959 RepID=B8MDI1_TALSN|nr:uncharacterized protein TSTA_117290 [Talaromyces stipitatus ATCC 10500]EED17944.1 conserved hypothetical protein [Talaromyces stipitatus ATCC 10500]